MRWRFWVGAVLIGAAGSTLFMMSMESEARAQRVRGEGAWEYKVGVFSYNPGERMTDEQRAAFYEKTLNTQARDSWEPVGSILSRDTVQTVGGGVATRDTTSFVAYRRAKR